MSWKASGYVKEDVLDVSRSEKLVLLVLADYFNDTKEAAFPSVSTIAENAIMTRRNVFRCLDGLEKKGHIERFVYGYSTHGGLPLNGYRMPSFAQWKAARPARCQDVTRVTNEAEQGDASVTQTVSRTIKESDSLFSAEAEESAGVDSPVADSSSSGEKEQNKTAAAVVRACWDYYIAVMQKNPRLYTLTGERMKKGLNAFRICRKKTDTDEAALRLMMCVVDAVAGNKWLMGKNDCGIKYNSWERHLFRSQQQIEERLQEVENRG
jgi:hypothetical protein